MTLLDAIRCAADEHPRRSRRALTEAQAERVLAVVLEAAERAVWPVVAKSWEGNEVVRVLRALGHSTVVQNNP